METTIAGTHNTCMRVIDAGAHIAALSIPAKLTRGGLISPAPHVCLGHLIFMLTITITDQCAESNRCLLSAGVSIIAVVTTSV